MAGNEVGSRERPDRVRDGGVDLGRARVGEEALEDGVVGGVVEGREESVNIRKGPAMLEEEVQDSRLLGLERLSEEISVKADGPVLGPLQQGQRVLLVGWIDAEIGTRLRRWSEAQTE